MKGKIDKVKTTYGFIKATNGAGYFFHQSDFNGHWDDLVSDFELTHDINVTFDISDNTSKGPRAENVRRMDWPNQ